MTLQRHFIIALSLSRLTQRDRGMAARIAEGHLPYDVKIFKEVIRLRKKEPKEPKERDERDMLLDTYLNAIETAPALLEAAE